MLLNSNLWHTIRFARDRTWQPYWGNVNDAPAEGYKGLVTGKPLVAVYARGGAYGPGSGREGYDQQSVYLKQIFGFIGVTDIWEIFVEPTLASPTSQEESVAAANSKAAEMAAHF